MKDPTLFAAGLIALSAGTFAFRFAGPVLRQRISFPPWAERLLETAAVILLAALVVTTGLTEGHHLAGLARPAGVCAGGILAWRKAPFLVVVLAAAVTTAVLRLLGVRLRIQVPNGSWCVRRPALDPPERDEPWVSPRSSVLNPGFHPLIGAPRTPDLDRRPVAARMSPVKVPGRVDVVDARCGQVSG